MPVAICISEDRRSFQPAIELVLLSIRKHSPGVDIWLNYPAADDSFVRWLARHDARVDLCTDRLNATGFNVKPHAILHLLHRGYDDVIWIDSDIIVMKDPLEVLKGTNDLTVIATEEALWTPYFDWGLRARKWGFSIGRALPCTLNSAVVRATRHHCELLEEWKRLLATEQYVNAQRLHWRERPLHMQSDQDVLSALLASDQFAEIPLKILARGSEIVQYFGPYGYTLRERFLNLVKGGPVFLHSQGPEKPWLPDKWNTAHGGLKDYLYNLYSDVSPYTLAAMEYRAAVSESTSWMMAHSKIGNALRVIGLGKKPLTGLPIAVLADLYRLGARFGRNERVYASVG